MFKKKDFMQTPKADAEFKPYSGKFIVIPRKNHAIVKVKNDEKLINQLFSQVKNNGYAVYRYDNDTKFKWRRTSSIIGNRCKQLIKSDTPFLFPPTTNRNNQLGMIVKPKNVEVSLKKEGNINNYIFTRGKNIF